MFKLHLQRFATVEPTVPTSQIVKPINVTGQDSVKTTMKPFYEKTLLENAKNKMVFTPLGKKVAMKGNKIEFRRWNTFAKALTPLTEGIVPDGQKFGQTSLEIDTYQHGDYVSLSDRLQLESFDDVIYGATEEMGDAEGATFDTLTRDKILTGSAVAYAPKGSTPVTSRAGLDNTAILTPALINKIATSFRKKKVPTFDGYYVMVIHPSQSYDLRESAEWKEFHKYADVAPIFKGEIGTLHGFRFIEDANVKVYRGAEASFGTYGALAMGKDAFVVLDPEGEGMEMIIKDKSEVGGPLEQFSTIGYKFCHGAGITYQERILRVETGSSLGADDLAN